MLHDIESISAVDGYEEWRQKESEELTNLVQERFKYLQNPEDCDSARKLVCTLNKVCSLNKTSSGLKIHFFFRVVVMAVSYTMLSTVLWWPMAPKEP